jgi:hypothetical protein
MGILHSILTELGVSEPARQRFPHAPQESNWIVDQPFAPVVGKCYEVDYGKVAASAASVIKKLRIDAASPEGWFDLEEGKPLDVSMRGLAVKAFRPLE